MPSRLFHLAPIAIGTSRVESLTSYLERLAAAHVVNTGSLVTREIARLIGPGSRSVRRAGSVRGYLYRGSGALNGVDVGAYRWAGALSKLTGRPSTELQRLTLWPLRHVLPDRGLVRPTRAWCPECLAAWADNGTGVYSPLLWSFQLVRACIDHGASLVTVCAACAQSSSPLAWHSHPGHCSRCGTGQASHFPNVAAAAEDLAVAEAVAALLAAESLLTPAEALKSAAQQLDDGNTGAFARRVGRPRATVWRWCSGTRHPTLGELLSVSAALGIEPVELLNVGNANRKHHHRGPRRRRCAAPHMFEVAARIRAALQAAFEDPSCPTVAALARDLKVSRPTLYRHAPDLCRAVSGRHRDLCRSQASSRLHNLCQRVIAATAALYASGVTPTELRVAAWVGRRGIFRNPAVRCAWHDARQQRVPHASTVAA